MSQETIREPEALSGDADIEPQAPGLVLIFSGSRPYALPFQLRNGRLEVGRDELHHIRIADDHCSRRHLSVERGKDYLTLRDLGSTNGVFVGGQRVVGPVTVPLTSGAVVRIGRSVFLVVPDLAQFERALERPTIRDGIVAGPVLAAAHQKIAALGAAGQALFIRGESGSGKEIAARVFHEASTRRDGPLVAINCATISKDIAERLLFGTVRGAYSGAVSDAQGYLQAANGGTIFLDEVAELDLAVQAKLLRVLETREVVPLGGTRGQPVDFGLCAATNRDLREAVAAHQFREDLYYRIGRPEVRLPPLRERLEEIPHLIELTVRAAGLSAGWSLVEECLLRPWPGNVRELCSEVRSAAVLAAAEGSPVVLARHLGEHAGKLLARAPANPGTSSSVSDSQTGSAKVPEGLVSAVSVTLGLAHKTVLKLFPVNALLSLEEGHQEKDQAWAARVRATAAEALFSLLAAQDFNQTSVANVLGLSRTTLIKLMDDLGLPRATELDAETITRACAQSSGDLDAAAQILRVSPGALKKRATQLNLKARG